MGKSQERSSIIRTLAHGAKIPRRSPHSFADAQLSRNFSGAAAAPRLSAPRLPHSDTIFRLAPPPRGDANAEWPAHDRAPRRLREYWRYKANSPEDFNSSQFTNGLIHLAIVVCVIGFFFLLAPRRRPRVQNTSRRRRGRDADRPRGDGSGTRDLPRRRPLRPGVLPAALLRPVPRARARQAPPLPHRHEFSPGRRDGRAPFVDFRSKVAAQGHDEDVECAPRHCGHFRGGTTGRVDLFPSRTIRLHGISTSWPRRRRDLPLRNIHAFRATRPASTEYPRVPQTRTTFQVEDLGDDLFQASGNITFALENIECIDDYKEQMLSSLELFNSTLEDAMKIVDEMLEPARKWHRFVKHTVQPNVDLILPIVILCLAIWILATFVSLLRSGPSTPSRYTFNVGSIWAGAFGLPAVLVILTAALATHAARIFPRRVAATPWLRRGYSVETGRGDAVAATWIFRGYGSRRRRGCVVDIRSRLLDGSGTRGRNG